MASQNTADGRTSGDRKERILAAIASRGWTSCEIYLTEARELYAEGRIKLGVRFSVGGNRKSVWVSA